MLEQRGGSLNYSATAAGGVQEWEAFLALHLSILSVPKIPFRLKPLILPEGIATVPTLCSLPYFPRCLESELGSEPGQRCFKDHVPRVAALVAVVFIMQRLVQVADEMNHEFEGLCLSVFVSVRVFQDGEELFRLGDHAITVRALAGQVDPGIRQGDVDIVPWAGLAVVVPVLVGPH